MGSWTSAARSSWAESISAFAIGLPFFSAFLVMTRAFYAMSDACTPAFINGLAIVVAGGAGAAFFFALPSDWSVAGLALGHSLAFAVGAAVLGAMLASRTATAPFVLSIRRVSVAAGVAIASAAAGLVVRALMDAQSRWESLVTLAVCWGVGAIVYVACMKVIGAPELGRITDLFKGRERV